MPKKNNVDVMVRKGILEDVIDVPQMPTRTRGWNPTKWNPRWRHPETKLNQCKHMIHVMARGGHIARVCLELGIEQKTFYRWKSTRPEFARAYEVAKLYSIAFYEEVALKGTLGLIDGFNPRSLNFILQSKMGWKTESRQAQVNVENMNVLDASNMSDEELKEKIKVAAKRVEKLELDHDTDE